MSNANQQPPRRSATVNGQARDHRSPLGYYGEQEAPRRLAARGHKILFHRTGLAGTNHRGFDLVSIKGRHVYFFDNKAYLRQGKVYSVSSLTRNFGANLARFKQLVESFIRDPNRSPAERQLFARALDAINNGRYSKVVTNLTLSADTNGPITGVSAILAKQGIKFWNLQKW